MVKFEKIEALQSASEAAGLAVACDFAAGEGTGAGRAANAAATAAPNVARPAADMSWAEPKFRDGFETPKDMLSVSFSDWLAARLPRTRLG